MNVLITGGTGFLGANMVALLDKDDRFATVRVFGLPGSETKYVDYSEKVEVVFGDITNAGDVDAAVAGMEVVFHVCGDTSFWRKLFERQRRINVLGTRNVCEACVKHGVRRLVHTSSVDVLGHDPNGVADETWGDFTFHGIGYNYAETKREGEQLALGYNSEKLAVVAIRPGMLVGEYDFTMQFGRLFTDLRDGQTPAMPPGGASFAHAREVARAHLEAAIRGRPGDAYNCAGENVTFAESFEKIAAKMGVKAPRFILPAFLFVLYGYIMEFISTWITGTHPEMNPGQARYMSVNGFYSSAKAERELGYKVLPLDTLIDDCYTWYRSNGFF